MGSAASFAAPCTKAKTLFGKLLKREQFIKLNNAKNYLDFVRILKEEKYFGDMLDKYSIDELDSEKLEYLVRKAYISNIRKITFFLSDEYKKILKIYLAKFQIMDLKKIIRYMYSDDKEELNLLTEGYSVNKIDFNKVMNSKNLDEVISNLKDTFLYDKIFQISKYRYPEDAFKINMELDIAYYTMLKASLKMVDNENRECIKKIIGIYADITNLQYIYRCKKFYKLPSEEIYQYIIKIFFRINVQYVKELCDTKDFNEFLEKVKRTPYEKIFSSSEISEYQMEKEIAVYLRNSYFKFHKGNGLNMASILEYIEILFIEEKCLISLLQSKNCNGQFSLASIYIDTF